MTPKKINWAILGTSPISEVLANAILESEHSSLVAIGSRSSEKANEFAAKFSIPNKYSNYYDLLSNDKIDAVYIGLPNHLHKEWIIRCAQAGKHILCEKPLVLNTWEASEAYAAVEKAQVICMEALMYRYHPLTEKLHDVIQEQTVGPIKLINATYTANISGVANPTAGGSIRNLGCYPVSLVRYLAKSEPIQITGFGRKNVHTKNDNQASAILKFSNDLMAVISTADDIDTFWQFEVYGTQGCLKMLSNPWMPKQNNKIVIDKNGKHEEITVTADHSLYVYQINAMNNKINKLSAPEISWQDSLGNVRVLEKWLSSI